MAAPLTAKASLATPALALLVHLGGLAAVVYLLGLWFPFGLWSVWWAALPLVVVVLSLAVDGWRWQRHFGFVGAGFIGAGGDVGDWRLQFAGNLLELTTPARQTTWHWRSAWCGLHLIFLWLTPQQRGAAQLLVLHRWQFSPESYAALRRCLRSADLR